MHANHHFAFAYLHDSAVQRMTFSIDDRGVHTFVLHMVCHPDSGHSEWSGQRLLLTAHDVIMSSMNACGYASGQDSINTIQSEVSAAFSSKVFDLVGRGVGAPSAYMRLKLNSGTEIEIACESIDLGPYDSDRGVKPAAASS